MGNSLLDRLERQDRAFAHKVRDAVREALRSAGLKLPSLAVERTVTGGYLVQLGGVTPEVASELATLVWTGAPYVHAVRGGEFTGTSRIELPYEQGELLVDTVTGRVGEFSRVTEQGELLLLPVGKGGGENGGGVGNGGGGEPWPVDRCGVRHPAFADLVRAGITRPARRSAN
ncbi:hypothetical protein [Kitasatospora phosalacinea]|uniref:hypothetical protein n=1 Tax=Kitasatospora phosalacinea TaxID=2065 RepID=UPI0005253C78|nr:hypothetical protein [Kitasatospora phosalacinea]